jgi:glutaredoxin 3
MNTIKIYTTSFCIYCYFARRLLKKLGLEFEELNVGRDPELRDILIEKYRWRTLPIITVNGTLIGGYSELRELEKSGGINQLLYKDPE